MSEQNTGGPAFPVIAEGGDTSCLIAAYKEGMTLRDWFAGKALQGMLTTSSGSALGGLDGYEVITAKAAYKIADAMLKAREE